MAKQSAEYEAILERYIRDEPHVGYSRIEQLGELTEADVGAVLAHEPDLMADALADPFGLHASHVGAILMHEADPVHRSMRVGAYLTGVFRCEVKRYLLRQVICACDVREQERANEARDAKAGFLSVAEM